MRSARGFTLLELLIVISLIIIMSGALMPSFSNYVKSQNYKQAQEQLKSDLRSIQNKALAGTGSQDDVIPGGDPDLPKYWLVYFQTGQQKYSYYLSTTGACPPTASNSLAQGQSENLPGGMVIANSSNVCVAFDLKAGGVSSAKKIHLQYPGESRCVQVTINTTGLITSENLCN